MQILIRPKIVIYSYMVQSKQLWYLVHWYLYYYRNIHVVFIFDFWLHVGSCFPLVLKTEHDKYAYIVKGEL